jgi:hypothetical protein
MLGRLKMAVDIVAFAIGQVNKRLGLYRMAASDAVAALQRLPPVRYECKALPRRTTLVLERSVLELSRRVGNRMAVLC